jgi:starch phosphorylase
MELGLHSSIKTYAGGLGILAGDTLQAAADLGLPMVGVSLVHRLGHFKQRLDESGRQHEAEDPWSPELQARELPTRVEVQVEGRTVVVRAFRHVVRGRGGSEISVYLLDTQLPENSPEDALLTSSLYGGDLRYRLSQEVVLGMGGSAMLEALGHTAVDVYHMNEGHSALLALALLEREGEIPRKQAVDAVRDRCVFTTHTPVPAGHDQFPMSLAERVLGTERIELLSALGGCMNGSLNMTQLALFFSRYVNGVAMRHGEISKTMFPGYPIASITNGVHAERWVAEPLAAVYDRHITDWREQNQNLRYAVGIALHEIESAHAECKHSLLREVADRTGREWSETAFTLGFARRATPYKRAELLLGDLDRLKGIAQTTPLQILYAGKAHPQDEGGKEIIRRIVASARELAASVPIVYLADYDIALAQKLCSGVDLWLNTPKKPEEASGTSGMKAALNGIPSLSVLDGWWIEGHVEGVTGWSVGESWEPGEQAQEASLLYEKLETIAHLFFADRDAYAKVRRYCIALNGSFFNAQRMVEQYAESAYRLRPGVRD